MKTSRTKIARAIADKTLKRGAPKAYSRQVAAYLLEAGRVNELDSILRDVQADWAEAGHVEVLATSAHPLSAPLRADIAKQIKRLYPKADRVVVSEVHDPSIIGSVRLNLANRQLDLSLQAKLNKFKQLVDAGKD